MDKEELKRRRIEMMASYAMLPFMLGVPPIIGWYIGSWLDEYFGFAPYAKYTLLVLGVISGIREVSRIINKYKDEEL